MTCLDIDENETIMKDNSLLGYLLSKADQETWNEIAIRNLITNGIIEKFSDRINWDYVSCIPGLSEEFMIYFSKMINWDLAVNAQDEIPASVSYSIGIYKNEE